MMNTELRNGNQWSVWLTLCDKGTDVRRVETSCIETDDKFYKILRIP
jgi:hypothetical protein